MSYATTETLSQTRSEWGLGLTLAGRAGSGAEHRMAPAPDVDELSFVHYSKPLFHRVQISLLCISNGETDNLEQNNACETGFA